MLCRSEALTEKATRNQEEVEHCACPTGVQGGHGGARVAPFQNSHGIELGGVVLNIYRAINTRR